MAARFLAVIVVLSLCLTWTHPAYTSHQLLLWPNGSSFTTFGPSEGISIDLRAIEFACDTIDPAAAIYIVPSGSATLGSQLQDVLGAPNSVFGASGGVFVSGTIGFSAPSGTTKAGIADGDFASGPPLFGHRVCDALPGSDASLGDSRLRVAFINSHAGDPLPDLLELFINRPGDIVFLSFLSTAQSPGPPSAAQRETASLRNGSA